MYRSRAVACSPHARRAGAIVLAVATTLLLAGCSTLASLTGPGTAAGPDSEVGSVRSGAVAVKPADATSAAAAKPKAKPTSTPNPCAGNTHSQFVLVSIAAQHLWTCSGAHQVYDTPVTTGASALPDDRTPTGQFEIEGLNTHSTLTPDTGEQYQVKYWIPFQAPLYGFHDSSWQTFPYGSKAYRTQGSHGCVHLPLAAIRFLYNWVDIGAAVTIRA
jgi:hypothetical protein